VAEGVAAGPLAGIDGEIERAIETLGCIGVGVSIVKDDEVVLSRGYGVRQHDTDLPYTDRTVQNIGSISKVYAADSVGILVSDGLVSWNDLITKHLPWFKLADPWTSANTMVRDIPAYRLGTTLPPLGFYILDAASSAGGTRRGHVERLRHFSHHGQFRDKHIYGNELFAVLGQLVEEVSGHTWEDFLETRLFEPLGMPDSSGDFRAYAKAAEPAGYHQEWDGAVFTIPATYQHVAGCWGNPAGGVHTCAADMTKWMRLHLNNGIVDDRRIIDHAVMEEQHTLQSFYRDQMQVPAELRGILDYRTHADALGWHHHLYRKEFMLYKSGGNPGIRTRVALLPDHQLGVYVQSNTDAEGRVGWAVIHTVFDRYLRPSQPIDWVNWYSRQPRDQSTPAPPPLPANARESIRRPLADYEGRYSAEGAFAWPGSIEAGEDRLVFRLGSYQWDLLPWRDELFLMLNTTPFLGPNYDSGSDSTDGHIFARMVNDPEGRVAAMVMEDGRDQIAFHRLL
jgi:CubicO group peptidase (beta-lactamase class C family)